MTAQVSTFIASTRDSIRSLLPEVLAAAGSSASATTKRDGSVVTATDQLVESKIAEALSRALPGVPILGEEATGAKFAAGPTTSHEFYSALLTAPLQLIVDPIDGTKNFVEGRAEYCIAVALTRRTENGIWPVAAVVAIPHERTIVWCDGTGVFCEDVTSGSVSRRSRDTQPSGCISAKSKDRVWMSAEGYELRLPSVSSGSSVYDLTACAFGKLQGAIVSSQRLWDLMAPLAIAEQLGVILRDLKTGERVTSLRESDLQPDFVTRPWGIVRRMIMLPADRALEDVVRRSSGRAG